MIPETRTTRPRYPERSRVYRTNKDVTLTFTSVSGGLPFAYEFRQEDDGYWIVRDTETGIFGHGDDLPAAVADFHIAAAQHLDVLEREPALSEELSRQREYLRARIRR